MGDGFCSSCDIVLFSLCCSDCARLRLTSSFSQFRGASDVFEDFKHQHSVKVRGHCDTLLCIALLSKFMVLLCCFSYCHQLSMWRTTPAIQAFCEALFCDVCTWLRPHLRSWLHMAVSGIMPTFMRSVMPM